MSNTFATKTDSILRGEDFVNEAFTQIALALNEVRRSLDRPQQPEHADLIVTFEQLEEAYGISELKLMAKGHVDPAILEIL